MLKPQDFALDLLVEQGRLTPEQAAAAQRRAAETRTTPGDAAVALELISSRDLAVARAMACECPYVDIAAYEVDVGNAALLPRAVAQRHLAFPLFNLGTVVVVGMADPLDLRALDRVRAALRVPVEVVLCEPDALRGLIERAYSLTAAALTPTDTGGKGAEAGSGVRAGASGPATDAAASDDAPVVAAVNQILRQAVEQGASDVHVSPDEHQLHLRYRIDGVLHVRQGPPLASHAGLVQRLKVMANLDLTQTRRPQDGKFRFTVGTREVDVRVSIVPTVCGENVVLRLLRSAAGPGDFRDLGLAPALVARLEELIERPHGMLLATGPTGSGKTTTLYTALRRLNRPERNVITIEDPVEIRLPMVRQVQVNSEVGMTFAGALRSILRQDPDVILVGEIRDEETARIAVQAALTGHLVLSTLHTNDAPGAVARLRDFGCPSFAINASVAGVLAQRLVRRVCPACAAPETPDPRLARRFALEAGATAQWQRGAGCPRCAGTGYQGRMGVFELLEVSVPVAEAIDRGDSTGAIRRAALSSGMKPMWRDGLEKAAIGLTTLSEVVRVAAGTLEADAIELREPQPSHDARRAVA